MPLDTSTTYPLTKLRLDGRRWNELRLIQAQISTNPASSGSSYLSMGNTSIMCTVHGPHETSGAGNANEAVVEVDVNIAGFASIDRKRRGGGSDRYIPSLSLSLSLRSEYQNNANLHKNLIDNPPNSPQHSNPPSSPIYTPIYTRTAQSQSNSPSYPQTAPSSPPP